MKKNSKNFLLVIIFSLLFLLVGCSGQKIETINVDEVKEYADTAAEKIFNAINEENYGMFSEDFDEQMSAALTEEKFNQIVAQLGKYESGEITGADKVDTYTRVYYKTRFSKISKDVTFTIVFSGTEEKRVSGLFYK